MAALPAAAEPPAPVAKVLEQQPKTLPGAALAPAAIAPAAALPPAVEPIAPLLKRVEAMPAAPVQVEVTAPIEQAERSRERLAQAAPSITPVRPNAVPQGGLMKQIQNNTQSQDRRMHVEKVEINNGSKPMTPLELENMIGMAVG